MWTKLCNFICDKLSIKPTTGQKRRNEDWTDDPPIKQMRFDDRNIDEFNEVRSNMPNENSSFSYEEDCTNGEGISIKWGSSMARQSIHFSRHDSNPADTLGKRRLEANESDEIFIQPLYQFSDTGEAEDVKYENNGSAHNHDKSVKNNPTCRRFISSYQTRQNSTKEENPKPTAIQTGVKKSVNFIKESFRLAEKVQYMQLLQQQATKLHSLLVPISIQQLGFQKESKPSVPVVDLTKEKMNLTIDRSKENIPRTSSQMRSNGEPSTSSSNMRELPPVNSLQDMLKTHPVTEVDIIDEILTRHSSERAEKLRQAEIEEAKLEVLSATNRKAYNDSLEEKLRNYMRITTPVLEVEEEERYVLPKLTREQELRILALLVPSPAGEVLVEKFGLQIKRRDLQTLKGLNWLNDEIINFYMNLIIERGKQNNMPKVYAFNTFFYPKLLAGGHECLKRWTKKIDIFSHDMIFVPVHLGVHWCMSVIDFRSKEVRYYDSMGSANKRCLSALLTYLKEESLDKRKIPYSTSDWEEINVENIPQQMNGSDCGVFSCMFAEHLARDCPLLFTQENMPYFRKKMAIEIVETRLLT